MFAGFGIDLFFFFFLKRHAATAIGNALMPGLVSS